MESASPASPSWSWAERPRQYSKPDQQARPTTPTGPALDAGERTCAVSTQCWAGRIPATRGTGGEPSLGEAPFDVGFAEPGLPFGDPASSVIFGNKKIGGSFLGRAQADQSTGRCVGPPCLFVTMQKLRMRMTDERVREVRGPW